MSVKKYFSKFVLTIKWEEVSKGSPSLNYYICPVFIFPHICAYPFLFKLFKTDFVSFAEIDDKDFCSVFD